MADRYNWTGVERESGKNRKSKVVAYISEKALDRIRSDVGLFALALTNYAMYAAESKILKTTRTALKVFYADYPKPPRIYERTEALLKHSFRISETRTSQKTYGGHSKVSLFLTPEAMQPIYNSIYPKKKTDADLVVDNFELGSHGGWKDLEPKNAKWAFYTVMEDLSKQLLYDYRHPKFFNGLILKAMEKAKPSTFVMVKATKPLKK